MADLSVTDVAVAASTRTLLFSGAGLVRVVAASGGFVRIGGATGATYPVPSTGFDLTLNRPTDVYVESTDAKTFTVLNVPGPIGAILSVACTT